MDKSEVEKRKLEFESNMEKMRKSIEGVDAPRLMWRFYDVLANLFHDKTFWTRYGLGEHVEE